MLDTSFGATPILKIRFLTGKDDKEQWHSQCLKIDGAKRRKCLLTRPLRI